MNRDGMEELGKNAGAWAKAYVRIKEQLMREGVPEEEAVKTARALATAAMLKPPEEREPWEG